MTAFPPFVHPYMPQLIVHIGGGILAIIAGYTDVLASKGENLHRAAGKGFVFAMVILAAVATYLAISLLHVLPGQPPNVAAGVLLGLVPLAFMIFWLIRVRIGMRFKSTLALSPAE